MQAERQRRGADEREMRTEIESLRARLKAAEREAERMAAQAADAERRAEFAQEVLNEERRQAERERVNLEKLIKALGGTLTEPEPPPPPPKRERTAPRPAAKAPQEAEAPGAEKPAAPADEQASLPDDEPEESPLAYTERRSSIGRFIGRHRSQPGTPRKCSVCGRRLKTGDEEELRAGGWVVSGSVAVCGPCSEDGWELEKEARLPFRRASQKDSGTA